MSEQEIQKEVEARVQFKLKEFFTGMENRIRHNSQSALTLALSGDFSNSKMAECYLEAWKQVRESFKKEVMLSCPSSTMHSDAKTQARREAIDLIFNAMEEENKGVRRWGYDRDVWLNRIISAVERAQKF